MKAVDTNVLVRLIADDDPDQSAAAAAWFDDALVDGGGVFVPDIVLAEVAWVLERAYRHPRDHVLGALRRVVETPGVVVRSPHEALRALAAARTSRAGIADLLLLEQARAQGCTALATFDDALLREPDVERPG
ncbi:MAG: PIN domain-containing protein [Alphaproteobacteria bacterium]|nr:PIN domain-containing protein [Alphaproteobacteria bacterium]